jgi:NAD(P)-dependent dehydrogenase (short-subunit alcohol dehydrogenase family)
MGTIFITGASRGIGAATARHVAGQGHDVAIGFRAAASAAERVAAECREFGGRALIVPGDVSSEADVMTMFETVDAELAPMTGFVNNAGVLEPQGRLESFTYERLRRVVDVNVIGAILCAGEAVRRMSTDHGGAGGSIVNVSSAAARLGSPNEYIDYAATKGAIDTMTIGLAQEVGREGIRVNAVRPGLIRTDIHASGGEPERVDRLGPNVPLGRGGGPDEVGAVIAWLLSEEASYVSGALIDVSGGR